MQWALWKFQSMFILNQMENLHIFFVAMKIAGF